MLSACGGGVGGGGGIDCAGTGTVFAGKAVYEDKLYDLGGFGGRVLRPVRFALVEIRDAAGGSLLASDRTSAGGEFCVGVPLATPPDRVIARVKADAAPNGGRVRVMDYVPEVYFVDSDAFRVSPGDFNALPTVTIREDTPWKQSTAPGGGSVSLAGGAFNILDVTTGGIEFVARRWGRSLPGFRAIWQDRQFQGLGTFFDPDQRIIHIKGTVQEDSDEYDDDIILHEFGHLAMHSLSKDTSPGGQHFINGNTQDARLAWSEGWANFFSAMVRDVDGAAYSNVSGVRGSLIDALFTSGASRSLRFAYEVATPEAFLPDRRNPANEPVSVTPVLFKSRVKYVTSEVSVATALWDIYAGGPGWSGVGVNGMRRLIEAMGDDNPSRTTFATFWATLEDLFPETADAVLAQMLEDRLLTLEGDAWGADDTPAQLDALTGMARDRHEFLGLQPDIGAPRRSVGHTLFPAGDVDLFRLQVSQPGTYRIRTTNLNDGADTYLRVLSADGTAVLAKNDNHIPLLLTVQWGTDEGPVTGSVELLSYPAARNGSCGPYSIVSEDGKYRNDEVYFCPPNAANRPDDGNLGLGDIEIPDYLAAGVDVDLAGETTYLVEVTRSPDAPPSAGAFGGYDLQVEGVL